MVTLKTLIFPILDGAFRPFAHRVEGHKLRLAVGGSAGLVLEAGQDRQIDGVPVFLFGSQRPPRISSSRSGAAKTTGSPRVSRLRVRVPVLSEHRMSMPAISSMDSRRVTMAFSLDRARAPTAMVTDSTAGRATGMEATVRMRANCTRFRMWAPRSNCTRMSTATKPTLR